MARSYMTQFSHQSTSRDIAGLAGNRVIKLITLGTPHHGSPAANGEARINLDKNPWWWWLLRYIDYKVWPLSQLAFVNPTAVNRREMRWDNYQAIPWDGMYLPLLEVNDWLRSLPKTFDNRIVAFFGSLSQIGEDHRELDVVSLGTAMSLEKETGVLDSSAVLLQRIMNGNFGKSASVVQNDGLVPVESGQYDSGNILKRVACAGLSHTQLTQNFRCGGIPLFSLIVGEIGGAISTQSLFDVAPGSNWNYGSAPISTSVTKGFVLSNNGGSELTVSSIGISGAGDFVVISAPTTPFRIAAGSALEITVRFRPGSGGAKSATLSVATNAAGPPPMPITLSGIGLAATTCTYALSISTQSFAASGGGGGFSVSTQAGCTWAVRSDSSWLTVNSPISGNGTGAQAVVLSATANSSGVLRTSIVTITGAGGQLLSFFVVQDASTSSVCSYSLLPGSRNYAAGAVADSFLVTTASSCGWSVSSQAPWITLGTTGNRTGSVPVAFSLLANTSASPRTGTVTVAGSGGNVVFSVTQAGTGNSCSYAVNPPQTNTDYPGGSGSFQVVTGPGCSWRTSISDNAWISFTSNTYGTGSGSVAFTVSPNFNSARTSYLSVQGDTQTVVHTVSQLGQPSVNPSIALPSATFNLGNALVGSPTYQTVAVRNNGNGPLYIGGMYFVSGSPEFSVPPAMPIVPPQSVGYLTVTMTPTSLGPKSGLLRILSNDPGSPSLDVAFSATAIAQGSGGSDFVWSSAGVAPATMRFACATIAPYIYCIGNGVNSRFDATTRALSAIPAPSGNHSEGGVAAINGKVYLAGGDSRIVEIFDPVTNGWTNGPTMPTQRDGVFVTAVNNKLYIIGGRLNLATLSALVDEYNPATSQWSAKAAMPTARAFGAVASVNGIIYVIGGRLDDGVPTQKTEGFNPESNLWTPREDMPTARSFMTASVLENKIFVVGGFAQWNPRTLSLVEEFDPAKQDAAPYWPPKAWSPKASILAPRGSPGSGVVNNTLYVMGGRNIETYIDPTTVEAATLSASPSFRMPSISANFGNVPLLNGREIALTIQNVGNATLTITYSNVVYAADFSSVSGPSVVLAGGSGTLRLRFTPQGLGSKTNTLRISTNDTRVPFIDVVMNGTGVAAPLIPSGQSFQTTKTISLPATGWPRWISLAGETAYVSAAVPPELHVVDLPSGSVKTSVSFGAYPLADAGRPVALGSKAYVPLINGSSSQLAIVDLNTKAIQYVGTTSEPYWTGAAGTSVYVVNGACWSNGDANVVRVFDTTTNTFTRTIPSIRNSGGFAIDPVTGRGYITGGGCDGSSTAPVVPQVLDTTSNTIVGSVGATYSTGAVSIAGNKTYMLESGFVDVVDIPSNRIIAQIAVSVDSYDIAAGTRFVYVVSRFNGGHRISVIDAASNAIVAEIPIIGYSRIAVDPETNVLYVMNANSKTLSVIQPRQSAFSISCSASLAAGPGSIASATCTVSSQDNYSGNVALSCFGLPQGASCGFSPSTVAVPANGAVQVAQTVNIPQGIVAGSYNFSVRGSDSMISSSAPVGLTVSTCIYSSVLSQQNYGASGGTGDLTVSATTGCAFTATSNVGWLTVVSGPPNSGIVRYSIGANTSVAARSGTLTVGGQTLTVTQSGVSCSFVVSIMSVSAPSGGGAFAPIGITAQEGCAWTATSSVGWITVTSGSAGSGNGSVSITVAENLAGSARTGSLTVAGQTVTVVQAGAACDFLVSSGSVNAPAGGIGGVSIGVTAQAGCAWGAVSNVAWITVTSGGTGSGNGSVGLVVAANASVNSRVGTVTIGGQTVSIAQAGVVCSYVVSASTLNVAPSGVSGASIGVTTQEGCGWAGVSNVPWLTVTSGATGSGNGSVGYSVAANVASSVRVGTLTVGGQTVSVTQAGAVIIVPAATDSGPISGIGTNQTLTFKFSHALGFAELGILNVLINRALDGGNACYIAFSQPAGLLFLVANGGPEAGLSAPLVLGSAGSVSNNQCTIQGSGSSVVGAGNSLTLTLNISFSSAFTGSKVIYTAARDLSGAGNSGWKTLGSSQIPEVTPTYPRTGQMSPPVATGTNQTISVTFQDASSSANLVTGWMLINAAVDGSQACYVAYYAPGNLVFLYPDNGDGARALTMPLSGGNTVENSQCRINAQGSSTLANGVQLTLNLNVTMKGSFSGPRGVWTAMQNLGGQVSPWRIVGNWLVP